MGQLIKAPPIVLVVEDEALVNWEIADALIADGFGVLQAYTGEQALALLEKRSDVRVVFSDINLPGKIDGIALAAEIERRWPTVELLMTSAERWPDADRIPAISQYGRFVPKPYPVGAVTRRIHDIVAERAA